MFTELQITDFRGIADLKLSGFDRVNLIVGENNTGKTSLLEAIALVVAPGAAERMLGNFRLSSGTRWPGRWLRKDGYSSNASSIVFSNGEYTVAVFLHGDGFDITSGRFSEMHAAYMGVLGGWRFACAAPVYPPVKQKVGTVSVQHRAPKDLVSDFSEAVRSKEGEKDLESLLHSVDNRIQAVRLDFERETNQSYISADIGLSERVPIDQLGQGVNRLIAIFCELLGQRPDICLIDEIENGLHHTVLERIWQGIAVAAERLNIQVFATTHSLECLQAAHACFSKRPEYDFRVVQLYRVGEKIDGRVIGKDLIEAAINSEIELR